MKLNSTPNASPLIPQDKPCWQPINQVHKHSTPFWFGIEDYDHISIILKYYSQFLQLNEHRPSNSRQPLQFVGRVERYPLEHQVKDLFYTIDKVFIYQYAICYWGQVMPCTRTVILRTLWNNIDGIPIKQEVFNQDLKDYPGTPSKLYSFPHFDNANRGGPEFHYNHGCADYHQDWHVGYADLFNQCLQNTMPIKNHNTVEEDFIQYEEFEEDDDDYEYVADDDDEQDDTCGTSSESADYSYLLSAPGVLSTDFESDYCEQEPTSPFSDDGFSSEEDVDDDRPATNRYPQLTIEITPPHDSYDIRFAHYEGVLGNEEHVRRETHSPIVMCQ